MRKLRRLAPLGIGLVLLMASTSCSYPPGTRYVHKVFEVEVTQDVVYRTTTNYLGQTVDLVVDIYQPVGDTATERPAVMWMFGGGWVAGDEDHMEPYARDSAERGYVGVSLQYRLRNEANAGAIIDAWQDAAAGVAWLKDHAADYRIDPEAIVAGGYSAGAINTLHLLSASDPSPVAGGVIIAGLTPIEATAGDPPMIMHQGTADAIVPFSGAKATCDQTVEVGNVCDFFAYEGGDHFITYIEPHAAQIKDRTARAIFERVLVPLGYEAEQPGDPAAA